MRILKAGLAATVIVGLCLTGIAVAHTKYFPTSLVVKFEPGQGAGGTYSGKVLSAKAPCKAKRKIVITTSRGDVVGRGTSDSKGNFEFSATITPHGTVEAEAKQKRIAPKTRKHKHFCLAGRTHVAILR